MRISDCSSDVCSSDLLTGRFRRGNTLLHKSRGFRRVALLRQRGGKVGLRIRIIGLQLDQLLEGRGGLRIVAGVEGDRAEVGIERRKLGRGRSEEHTSELQSLMRISYAVFCLKKK